MANEMKVFESMEFGSVRVVEQNGGPWFVAKDVCDCLGFSDAGQGTRGLDDDEKTNMQIMQDGSNYKSMQVLISEAGLYSLILRSNKPEAKAFKRWVTREVLPSIRKHGAYVIEDVLNDPDMLINALQSLKAERAARLEAERTKSLIGSRREATAMATASAAVRKVKDLEVKANNLEEQLGVAGNYRTVKSIKWVPWVFDVTMHSAYLQIGKALNKLSKYMNFETKRFEDSTYGSVTGYHIDVIEEFHKDLLADESILEKYRRNV